MIIIIITFWTFLFLIFYTYLGYGILLFLMVKLKKIFSSGKAHEITNEEPEVTIFVTAYNEIDYVDSKMGNTLSLDYPKEKVKIIWVTDGSDDGTPEKLRQYEDVRIYHQPLRAGKIAAMNRGVKFVTTPIIIFSDANTILGKESIRRIVTLFKDPKVGCVSGEKRISLSNTAAAAEGIYWKYESLLKKWDAQLYSAVGAAGELFAIRTELYQEVEKDTLLDDFIISMRIAMKGYTIQYDPEAYSLEKPSANIKEELKRKIRISAGGIQSILRLKKLLNPFKYGLLSFQYVSHRVFRWTLAPLGLAIIFLCNILIAMNYGFFNFHSLYVWLFWLQCLFYLLVLGGWYFENRNVKTILFYVPFYFFIMNLSVYLGFRRYIKKQQSVTWERAKRG